MTGKNSGIGHVRAGDDKEVSFQERDV